ncbi:helix-turn-helix domain-containing protein [Candidatus Pristimantibacillus sp. PTI5]|uniref:helix-turn-helix domain-containing protein n=1 Tax=Candidatus Pristimantibacillus sp. PTI5 TaxID=3400422 RepID=UPI003B027E48
MDKKLFDQVRAAQQGDKESLGQIIEAFAPAIRQAKHQTNRNEQEDVQQAIIEMLIHKILSYDLSQTLDYSAFCKLNQCESKARLNTVERAAYSEEGY